MKPLTLEETALKEEMKNNCLKVGKYKDGKAKDKFKMLCHLEDFEIQYWELLKENRELKNIINQIGFEPDEIAFLQQDNAELKKQLEENKDKINWYENFEINKTIDKLRIKHNNQQQEFINYLEDEIYSFELRGTSPEYNFENVLKRILLKYKEIIGDDK